ncbi:MAG TPA: hypothetical protein VGM67_05135 [Gemmatimonadaceae bacterium]|jgi:hypothetical protein
MTSKRWRTTDWALPLALLVVTSVLVLQKSKKHALLPAKETPVLWAALVAGIASVLVLRSGWGRNTNWTAEQSSLGTLANNYYEPRREALIAGGAIAGGVLASLWWATATWSVMFYGMRRGVAAAGEIDFMVAALMGAIAGGLVGAVAGLAAGHFWERRHRRRRVSHGASHA